MRVASLCGLRVCAGCELRIAFKSVAFLRLILSDINYYRITIKGLIIKGLMIIMNKRFGGINLIMTKGFGEVITLIINLIKTSLRPH